MKDIIAGFFRKNFRGQTNVSRNRGGHRLELKDKVLLQAPLQHN